jgi:diketogulonate reductase-like aldo/keto reductase
MNSQIVEAAIRDRYRMIDIAAVYFNEREVGIPISSR